MRTLLAVCAMLLLAVPVQAQPNAADEGHDDVALIQVASPGFPYLDASVQAPELPKFVLRVADQKKNKITDEEEWMKQVGYEPAAKFLAPGADQLPAEGKFGRLKFFRNLPDDFKLAIYESFGPRPEAANDPGFGSIYDKDFSYVAVVLDSGNMVLKTYDLGAFFPGILEMSNIEVVDKVLYFDANYNGYADITKNKTGYLVAFDVFKGKVLWTSPALVASFRGFLITGHHIIAGYGFTKEPDFLYVLNRHTGAIEQKVNLKSAHEMMLIKGNRLYVRAYDIDYVFEF